jgi:hypothetical protein
MLRTTFKAALQRLKRCERQRRKKNLDHGGTTYSPRQLLALVEETTLRPVQEIGTSCEITDRLVDQAARD